MKKPHTILILGANSAIARELSILFDREGYHQILGARDTEATKQYSAKFRSAPVVMKFNANHPQEFLLQLADGSLQFDSVVYASGYLPPSDANPEQIEETVRVNYSSPVIILHAISEIFRKKKSGTIVGISSVAGDRGKQGSYVYGSAKAGFTVFLAELRNKLFAENVHVLTVKPGFVSTPMLTKTTPAFLTSTPSEAAHCIYKAFVAKKNVVYVKHRWRWVMKIIKMIPESSFKKMNM